MTRVEYQAYLKSDHWLNLRARKLAKSSGRCAICASDKFLEVHHLSYKNIFDVETSDLRVLCNRCHGLYHQLVNSGKLKLKPGSHHSLFAQTKHAVKVALGAVRPRRDERILPPHVLALRTAKGGWNKEALAQLGVPWPPPKGWLAKLRTVPLKDL